MERAHSFKERAQTRDNSRWQPRRGQNQRLWRAGADIPYVNALRYQIQRSHNPRDAVKRGQLRPPICVSRDRHQEWLRFLGLIDRQVPEGRVLSVQMHVLYESGDAACFSARSLV